MSGPESSGSAEVVVAVPADRPPTDGAGGADRSGGGGDEGSDEGGDLREVAKDPTKRCNVTRTRLAVAAFGVMVVAGVWLAFVFGLASQKPWEQPDAPHKPFEFARFASCKEMQEGFNAKVREGTSNSLLTEGDAEPGVRPDSGLWYPRYESDYCDYCNCSGSSFAGQSGPSVMMGSAVPESAAMATADTESGDASAAGAGAQAAPATAQDSTGTSNPVEGVDEADVIKTDGTYLYVIPRSGASLVISQVFPAASARVLSRVNLTQYNLRASDALLDKNVLAVIGTSQVRNAARTLSLSMVAVHYFDVTDRSNPRMKLAYELEGRSLTARFLNGFVYLVVSTCPTFTGLARRRSARSADSVSSCAPGGHAGSSLSLRAFAPLARTLSEREANVGTATPVAVAPVCECVDISYVKQLGTVTGWITVAALSTAGGQFNDALNSVDQVA